MQSDTAAHSRPQHDEVKLALLYCREYAEISRDRRMGEARKRLARGVQLALERTAEDWQEKLEKHGREWQRKRDYAMLVYLTTQLIDRVHTNRFRYRRLWK